METTNAPDTTVLAFESRMADTTAKLLKRKGIRVMSAPSMQEVPLEKHEALFNFGEQLFAGAIDGLICTTGVGTRMMARTLESRYELEDIRNALSELTIISRGPKPAKVLRGLKIPIDIKVPEPNTWKEILETLDNSPETFTPEGKNVAIQEYGQTNEALNEGLRKRGAEVFRVPMYRWELPDNLEPLKKGIQAVLDKNVQVVLFTSKTQIAHVMKLADKMEVKDALRTAMNGIYVASIGPVCSKGLTDHGIKVDFEPSRPKLAIFIKELSVQLANL